MPGITDPTLYSLANQIRQAKRRRDQREIDRLYREREEYKSRRCRCTAQRNKLPPPISMDETTASQPHNLWTQNKSMNNDDNDDNDDDNDDGDDDGDNDDNDDNDDDDDDDDDSISRESGEIYVSSTTSLDTKVVSALDPSDEISSVIQKILLEKMNGSNDYLDALLKLQVHNEQENRKKQAFQNEEKRKNQEEKRKDKAFRNKEKRKQELHEKSMKREQHDELDIQGQPALVSRMKILVELALPDNKLVTECPIGGCNSTISPFSFAVVGEELDSLAVCCVRCARQSIKKLRRQFVMDKDRVLTWLICAGENRQTMCAVCGVLPINLIFDEWQSGHINSKTCCGDTRKTNMFPCHGFCNREQSTRGLMEIRKCTRMYNTPFPEGMSEEDAEAFFENLK